MSDWQPAYGWTSATKTTGKKTQKDLKAEERRGNTDTVNKDFNQGNRKTPAGTLNTKTLDEDFDTFKHREVGKDFGKALMQARTAKGLNQKDLAQQLAEPASTIQQYESGKAIPNGQIIQKLNRILGTTLPKVQKPKKKPE